MVYYSKPGAAGVVMLIEKLPVILQGL